MKNEFENAVEYIEKCLDKKSDEYSFLVRGNYTLEKSLEVILRKVKK